MLVVDAQGFGVPDGFIPKELAITNGTQTCHYVFKPPCPFRALPSRHQKQVRWLENYHHGLRWSEGYVDLRKLPEILSAATNGEKIIYCKGIIKVQFLRKYLKSDCVDIIDLNDECDVSLTRRKGVPSCFSHYLTDNCACSLTFVQILYDYVEKIK